MGGGEDTLVCCTDKFQMMSISLSTLTNIKDNGGSFDNFLAPFHLPNVKGEAAITGIDVALWKNVVITCGKDKTGAFVPLHYHYYYYYYYNYYHHHYYYSYLGIKSITTTTASITSTTNTNTITTTTTTTNTTTTTI